MKSSALQSDAILPDGSSLPGGDIRDEIALEPISGFLCLIEYNGEPARQITCRRYDLIGSTGYVGAICSQARGYRQFRCDRIDAVFDALSGEYLGVGTFFNRFAADATRSKADTWGLSRSRHAHLLAGLNVLAFMAHCDGRWHPLEGEVIEDFACCLWLKKEWDGDPPLEKIKEHARRLAPDGSVFGAALKNFVRSTTSEALLRRFVARVVDADGTLTAEEFQWSMHFDELVAEFASYSAPEDGIM